MHKNSKFRLFSLPSGEWLDILSRQQKKTREILTELMGRDCILTPFALFAALRRAEGSKLI